MIVGLDIGTSTVRAVIGEFSENGELQITGVGKTASAGLNNGAIVNIEATLKSVSAAIESAEMMAGHEVTSVFTAIGGAQVDSTNTNGMVVVAGNGKGTREITQNDIDRSIEAAKAIPVPMGRQILHVIPQLFSIDGQDGIKNPINMIGFRLDSEVHIVTAAETSVQTLLRCISRANYSVDGVMLKSLAAAEATTNDEEKELGSIVIDLGAGSTDAIAIVDGAPICSVSVPYGGNNVTKDISFMRGISFESAERIKKSSGCCFEPLLEQIEEVIIPGVGGRPPESITRNELCKIIQPRIEEILTLVRDKIGAVVKERQLSGNVILCGGGAMLSGIVEVACEVFGTRSVRIGIPGNFGGLQEEYRVPEYAVATGLVVSNAASVTKTVVRRQTTDTTKTKKKNIVSSLFGWFNEFF